jgi:hypothetical protein
MPIKITNKTVKIHTDFYEFWPRWSLEKAEYDKAKITSVDEKPQSRYTMNGDNKQVLRRAAGDLGEAMTTWPRLQTTEETTYHQFIDSIVDSKQNKFYPARDEDRRPLPKSGAMHAITDIIRLKTEESEFLLSKGTIIGHDAAGEEVDFHLPWPERWFKTLFNWQNEYDNRSKGFIKRCLGPKGIEVQYTLPFTKENAKSLFDSRASDLVNFVVKQENSGEVKMVERDVNALKPFERFANNTIDYLWSAEYIPLPVRQELRQEAVARGNIKGGSADYQVQAQPQSKAGKSTYQ